MLHHLEKLGKTQRQIVDNLIKEKCFGDMGEASSCPIAIYLRKKTKKGNIEIDSTYIDINFGQYNYRTLSLPKRIILFVENFDKGKYKKLIIKCSL